MVKYIINDEGNPVEEPDTLAWGRWFKTAERRIMCDKLPNGTRVSTIFLGLDHSFGGGSPILYETMVFGGAHDGYQERYTTKEEALLGHKRAVELALG